MSDYFGDQQVFPRVGHQYQVEIPSSMTEDFIQNSTNLKRITYVDDSVHTRLPIPIMWVHNVSDQIKHETIEFDGNLVNRNICQSLESENSRESQMDSKSSLANQNPVKGDGMDVEFPSPQKRKSNLEIRCKTKDYRPVPYSLGSSWGDIEQESFLLGLYIFGKDLVQVKRFIESKEMGDVLSFYYGKFYGSEGYHRWSKYRKIKSRRYIHGQRIFMGWRQQKLLTRLQPFVSEDQGNKLLEATKTFSGGKISLKKYITILKAIVGLKVLVEAVGIGKGKNYDLTINVVESIKTNLVTAVHSEVPTGKACSSLTSDDIIKFLTGDFRLSKARSNDIFWEAVWPRLLARGWHSEQPKDHCYVAPKHSLVFLIPGIKKFSRRKLVKGNHYFDSITDVLNKVASDPKLLDLEDEAVNGSRCKEEDGWDLDAKSDQISFPDHQRHHYLRPQIPNCDLGLMKFTIVDTSSIHRKEPGKLRELRTLPFDGCLNSRNASLSRETEGSSCGDQVGETDAADADIPENGRKGNINFMPSPSDSAVTTSMHGLPMEGIDSADTLNDIQNHDMLHDKHQNKSLKCQFTQRVRSNPPKNFPPTVKRRRLNVSCKSNNHCTGTFTKGPRSKERKLWVPSFSLKAQDIMSAEVVPSELKIKSSKKEIINKKSGCLRRENYFKTCTSGKPLSHESPQLSTSMDLNVPHIPSDFEADEPLIAEVADCEVDSHTDGSSLPLDCGQQPEDPCTLGTSSVVNTEQLPPPNSRRQSTRNRPLTIRALEAFQCGFSNTRQRRRPRALSHANYMRRSSQQRASIENDDLVAVSLKCNNASDHDMDSKADGLDECSSNKNMVSESPTCKKDTHDLLGIPTSYQLEILMGSDSISC